MLDLSFLPELHHKFYNGQDALKPIPEDLDRIYTIIRNGPNIRTALEFGAGYSTFVIAKALQENAIDFQKRVDAGEKINEDTVTIKTHFGFRCYTVEQDRAWLRKIRDARPEDMDNVSLFSSDCYAGTFNGQLCSYYDNLPNIIPDFIYLDAPDSYYTAGKVNGLSFNSCLSTVERDAMSADILLMEPSLFPGAVILVDGRMLNTTFLINNLKRNWTNLTGEDYAVLRLWE